MSTPGEIAKAIRDGYRVAVHASHFPFKRHGGDDAETVHAVVDHGARAIFCSTEWYEKSRPVKA
jgi:hypothetical protein